jgi:hypothetical protein
MDNLLLIALEAHHPERNHHRRYEISVGRDLLGHWTVAVRYGRAGSPLRTLRFGDADEAVMRRLVRERLNRRLSAPRRIGCRYRPRDISAATEVAIANWVPAALQEGN